MNIRFNPNSIIFPSLLPILTPKVINTDPTVGKTDIPMIKGAAAVHYFSAEVGIFHICVPFPYFFRFYRHEDQEEEQIDQGSVVFPRIIRVYTICTRHYR